MSVGNSRVDRTLIAIAVMVALLTLLIGVSPVAAAEHFGQPEQGRRVYDRTGLLTPDELAELEQAAADVEEAGAPVIVYLQAKEADFDATLEDARELMEDWDVQSEPEALDGVVIFLNLEPDDLRHGQLALVAGAKHFDGGNLPQYELDRITSEMRSLLADDETAAGIAAGLEMISTSLVNGPLPPPEPGRAEQAAIDLSQGPFSPLNIFSVLVAVVLAAFSVRLWRSRPVSASPATLTTAPPGDLMPAAAGALVSGKINDMQMEATILDLARRGALTVEPEDEKNKVRIRLLHSSVVQNDFEQQVWNALQTESGSDGLITSKKLSKVRSHWKPAKDALQSGLEARGWYGPDAGRQRRPLMIAGIVVLVLAFVAFIITAIGEQFWGLLGAGVLVVSGLAAIIIADAFPNTTVEGESQAQPWRGYLEGLKGAKDDVAMDLDLDQAVPYALAMNVKGSLDKRLKKASEAGYSPLWLGNSRSDETWGIAGFYPYWASFHAGVSPTVGAGGGGAAAGSGGSGGGF